MRDVFVEKWQYETTKLRTSMGLFDFFIGSFIWGFILIKYQETIYNYLFNLLVFLPEIIKTYVSYLAFGIFLIVLGLTITFVLTKIFKLFFNNGRVL